MQLEQLRADMQTIVADLKEHIKLHPKDVFVIGCSTSEVAGETIGTSGTTEIAAIIFEALKEYAAKNDFFLAFQGCEHINRALIVERAAIKEHRLEEVSVVPVRNAGGAMATFAYDNFEDPAVVESIQAGAGIDIGDTFIGMHLKHVAVPVRLSTNTFGKAHITIAKTRPKLIGGERAVYKS